MSNLPFINSTTFFRGLNHYYQKDYPNAIKTYKTALTLDPHFPYALYNLAIVYDDYYEDKMPAIRTYEKFIELTKDKKSYQEMVDAANKRLAELKEQAFFSENKWSIQ